MEIRIEKHDDLFETHFHATVTGSEWTDAQNKAEAKLAKDVTVKGFRKGMAPLVLARQKLSQAEILNDAADKAVQKAFREMIDNPEVDVIMQPELVVSDFSKDKLSFYFKVIYRPKVTLGQYKNIEIAKEEITVTDADVEEEIQQLVNKNAELVVSELNYKSVNGDTVVIDFKGYVDGEAFDGGEASSYELELGSHSFVPGFEEQLVGVQTNDDKEVIVTFPENYVAELASKEATFRVHVNAVKRKVYPNVDDDFAKDLDIEGVDTIDQLKEHLRNKVKNDKTSKAEQESFEKLMTMICDSSTLECHQKFYDDEAKRISDDLKNRIEQNGFELKDYLAIIKKTEEEFNNEALETAKKNLKRAYVLDEIAKVEKIEVSDEEFENHLSELASKYNQTVDNLKKQFGNRIGSYRYQMIENKVIEFLKNNNNI